MRRCRELLFPSEHSHCNQCAKSWKKNVDISDAAMIASGGNQTPQQIYPEVASGKYWLAKRWCSSSEMIIKGGVEDTRPEVKDTKKIRGQGQGQPFRGQTLSRPRTGMLEAKAKDQGHKRECSPKKKKKGLHKHFSSDLHKITFSKKFFKRSTKF